MKNLINLKSYTGEFHAFYKEFIEEFLPPIESVERLHSLLVDYINDDKAPLIVRKFNSKYEDKINPFSVRGKLFKVFDRPFICSDNEAALWFYCRSFEKEFVNSICSINDLIENQVFPIGFARNSSNGESKEFWKKWGKLKKDNIFFSQNGWLVKQTSELQELACDEYLVGRKNLPPRLYSKCLYDVAANQLLKQAAATGAVGMAAEAKLLKRRVEAMFHKRKNTSGKLFASAMLVSIFTFSTVAWALKGTISDRSLTLKEATKIAKEISKKQKIPVVVDKNVVRLVNKIISSEESRKYMRESLKRMKRYEPMIKKKLKMSKLPLELMAVPLVESGYKNDVTSTMKASGIWQFIPETARFCGLTVDANKDERFEAEKLTDAAVCYYSKLFAVFQNWHVVLAAYNLGQHRLTTEITNAGHNDVLKLARDGKLGREGGSYLPKVMASMILLKNPKLLD